MERLSCASCRRRGRMRAPDRLGYGRRAICGRGSRRGMSASAELRALPPRDRGAGRARQRRWLARAVAAGTGFGQRRRAPALRVRELQGEAVRLAREASACAPDVFRPGNAQDRDHEIGERRHSARQHALAQAAGVLARELVADGVHAVLHSSPIAAHELQQALPVGLGGRQAGHEARGFGLALATVLLASHLATDTEYVTQAGEVQPLGAVGDVLLDLDRAALDPSAAGIRLVAPSARPAVIVAQLFGCRSCRSPCFPVVRQFVAAMS